MPSQCEVRVKISIATLATLFVLFATPLLTAPAGASLIFSDPDETSGTGLGAVNTVLTIQDEPTESGCVAWDGGSHVQGPAACPPGVAGGDETAITQTRTLSEIGLTSAFNLRVVFNYNEDNTDAITLETLILRIYAPDGTVLFSSEPFTPVVFTEPFNGTGTSGFVFRLDATQAAEANQYFDDPDNRIGLAAEASQTSGGPETFYVGDASAITPASADLSVVKTDSPDPVNVGDDLTYTLTVSNDGPNHATGVTVTDTLPASVTFVSATSPDGTCSQDGRIVTCDLGTLNSGDSTTITIVVTPQTDGLITNTTAVASDQSDPDPTNNTDSESTTVGDAAVGQADLSVVKSDSPDPVAVGDPLTYSLLVANAGPDPATNVTLTDTLPASVTFVSVSTPQGTCSDSGQTVLCDLGTIASGDDVTVTITVTPQQEGQITNTATVSSDEEDTDLSNNGDTEETQVGAGPPANADLAITKSDAPDPVPVGGNVVYTVNVDNDGPNAATGVTVSDTLPASFTFVSATATQGSCSETGGVVTCELGSLASGASASVEITAQPTMEGTFTNAAAVSADPNDPDPADNSATEDTTVSGTVDGAVPIPTAGTWALLALALGLAGLGVRRLV